MTKELVNDVLTMNRARKWSLGTTALTTLAAGILIATHHQDLATIFTSVSATGIGWGIINGMARGRESIIRAKTTWDSVVHNENKGTDLAKYALVGHGFRWLERGALALYIPGTIVAAIIPGGLGLVTAPLAITALWGLARRGEYVANKKAVSLARRDFLNEPTSTIL